MSKVPADVGDGGRAVGKSRWRGLPGKALLWCKKSTPSSFISENGRKRIERHRLLKDDSLEMSPPKRPSSPCLSLLLNSSRRMRSASSDCLSGPSPASVDYLAESAVYSTWLVSKTPFSHFVLILSLWGSVLWPGHLYRGLLSEMDSIELFFFKDVFSDGYEYLAYMLHMCTTCMSATCEVRESGVKEGCDPPCGCLELNLGSVKLSSAANCWVISLDPFWIFKTYLTGWGQAHAATCLWGSEGNFGELSVLSFPLFMSQESLCFLQQAGQWAFRQLFGICLSSPREVLGLQAQDILCLDSED